MLRQLLLQAKCVNKGDWNKAKSEDDETSCDTESEDNTKGRGSGGGSTKGRGSGGGSGSGMGDTAETENTGETEDNDEPEGEGYGDEGEGYGNTVAETDPTKTENVFEGTSGQGRDPWKPTGVYVGTEMSFLQGTHHFPCKPVYCRRHVHITHHHTAQMKRLVFVRQ